MIINFVIPFIENTGGILVVLEHAHQLSLRGHDVVVYYPMYPYREYWFSAKSTARKNLGPLKGFLVNLILFRTKVKWFHRPHRIRPVPWIGNLTVRDAHITMATAFPTAQSVFGLSPLKGNKFYFIQGHERWMVDPEVVDKTYSLPLELITIAPHLTNLMESRFNRKIVAEIHNGIDLKVFHPPVNGKKWESFTILMLYHENEVKGTNDGLKALAAIHEKFPNVRFALFSIFPPPANIPKYFDYYHNPKITQIVTLYQNAQIFLSPSHLEGWHLPPMEAMACGCAVVATRVGCIPTLHDGENLKVVEPKDCDEMVKSIAFLLENRVACESMALKGHQTITRYTWERASMELERVFLNSVANGSKSEKS